MMWYTALREHAVDAELVFYAEEGHIFERGVNRRDVLERSARWFQSH